MAGLLIRNGSLAIIRRLPFFLRSEPLYMASKVKELLLEKGVDGQSQWMASGAGLV